MRRFYLLLLFLVPGSFTYSQVQAHAGPDKVICAGCGSGVTIGNMTDNPTLRYSWKSSPSDPAVASFKTAKITVNPSQTTIYTLTVVGQDFSSISSADVKVTVIKIDKIQYFVNGVLKDLPAAGLQKICFNSSIRFKVITDPAGVVLDAGSFLWSGDASGSGEEKTATFTKPGNRSITVSCGTLSKTVTVSVEPENTDVTITWDPQEYVADAARGSSVTTEKPFAIEYMACADIANNVWRLRVKKITGSVKIVVKTGGSRDPTTNPPANQADAVAAVTIMKAYYTRGSRGSWHTEAASADHELHHYSEWKCASERYWPTTENCLEQFSVPYDTNPDEASAIASLTALGASVKVSNFKAAARRYWFTLGDGASDRPYAAGQLTLNNAITFVQALAAANRWVVPAGVDLPSAANPCYRAYSLLVLIPCPPR
jgi:hypothetical protein